MPLARQSVAVDRDSLVWASLRRGRRMRGTQSQRPSRMAAWTSVMAWSSQRSPAGVRAQAVRSHRSHWG